MWIRTLAGAYAGQIRDYSTECGLRAIRSGMGIRVEGPHEAALSTAAVVAAVTAPVTVEKRRKGRPAVETTAAKR